MSFTLTSFLKTFLSKTIIKTNFLYLSLCLALSLALTACGGGGGGGNGDDNSEENEVSDITVEDAMLRIEAENSYVEDGYREVQKRLDVIGKANVYSISADVIVDPSSTVTPSSGIETEIRLRYYPSSTSADLVGDEGYYGVVLRMMKNFNNPEPFVLALSYICTDENCNDDTQETSNPFGDFENRENISDWSSLNNLSLEYNDNKDGRGQRFIFTFNGDRSELPIDELNNSNFFLTNGITFNQDDLLSAQIRSRVRHINNPGDRGYILAYYDNVMVNGELYDNFSNGLDESKWELQERFRFKH